MIVGNDISKYQGNIDWNKYKSNTNFVIIKASEGIGYTDSQLAVYQSKARELGIPLGYYHFARPDLKNDAAHEADWFLQTIGELKEGEILCLDFEVTYNDAVNWCKNFLDRIKFMTNGCKAFIYLNQSQCGEYDWKSIANADYPLWIAAYTPDSQYFSGAWLTAAMQQWTSSQQVPGIMGNVDGDHFFGDVNQFKAYGYKKPVPPPATPPAPPAEPPVQPPVQPPAPPVEPPVQPPVVPVIDYKKIVEEIKAITYGKGWWWVRLNKIKDVFVKYGV